MQFDQTSIENVKIYRKLWWSKKTKIYFTFNLCAGRWYAECNAHIIGYFQLPLKECSNSSDDEENPIKSIATVKHQIVRSPVNFARLEWNTDLNVPPPNWMSSSFNSYGFQQAMSHPTGFSRLVKFNCIHTKNINQKFATKYLNIAACFQFSDGAFISRLCWRSRCYRQCRKYQTLTEIAIFTK